MTTERIDVIVTENGSRVVRRELESIGEGADKSTNAVGGLKKMLATFGVVLGVNEIRRYVDTWSDMSSRVGVAIGNMQAVAPVMERISDMARRTYSNLENTAEGFLRNTTVLKELGYTTEDTLDYVEALNNAMVVSGAKGARAESVMNALNKAMAAGKLSGEELNTVIQQGGRVTEVLAQHLGVTTLELRKLGREGKITSEVMFSAMTGALEELREQADAMPATIEDGMTLIRNSLMRTLGVFDQANKISESFATTLVGVADNMGTVAEVLSYLIPLIGVKMVAALYAKAAALTFNIRQMILYQATLAKMAGMTTMGAAAVGAMTGALGLMRGALALVGGPLGLLAIGIYAAVRALQRFVPEADVAAKSQQLLTDSINFSVGLTDRYTWAADERRKAIRKETQDLIKNLEVQLLAWSDYMTEFNKRNVVSRAFRAGLGKLGIGTDIEGGMDNADRMREQLAEYKKILGEFDEIDRAARPTIDWDEIGGGKKKLTEHEEALQKIKGSVEEYAQQQRVLNDLLAQGAISQNEFAVAMQNTQLAADLLYADDASGMFSLDVAVTKARMVNDEIAMIYEQAYAANLLSKQEYEDRMFELGQKRLRDEQEAIRETYRVQVSATKNAFQEMTQHTADFAGEQSGIYKVMFAATKAFAIAEAIINVQTAMAKAMGGLPFPANIAAAAQVGASVMKLVSTIRSTELNFADGGYVGGQGTGRSDSIRANLSNGEFVVNAAATSRNRPMLEAINRGQVSTSMVGSGQAVVVNFDIDNNISIQGGESNAEALEAAAEAVSRKTQSEIMDSIRLGGPWARIIRQAGAPS